MNDKTLKGNQNPSRFTDDMAERLFTEGYRSAVWTLTSSCFLVLVVLGVDAHVFILSSSSGSRCGRGLRTAGFLRPALQR